MVYQRHYNPSTGRFLSQDTYGGNPYDLWTQRHSYCEDTHTQPVNQLTDHGVHLQSAQPDDGHDDLNAGG